MPRRMSRRADGGRYAASVSIRSGRGSMTHDRVMRFIPQFDTRDQTVRFATQQAGRPGSSGPRRLRPTPSSRPNRRKARALPMGSMQRETWADRFAHCMWRHSAEQTCWIDFYIHGCVLFDTVGAESPESAAAVEISLGTRSHDDASALPMA